LPLFRIMDKKIKSKFELLTAFLVESYSGDYVEYDIENRLPFVG
jgi:hypothetical protein